MHVHERVHVFCKVDSNPALVVRPPWRHFYLVMPFSFFQKDTFSPCGQHFSFIKCKIFTDIQPEFLLGTFLGHARRVVASIDTMSLSESVSGIFCGIFSLQNCL